MRLWLDVDECREGHHSCAQMCVNDEGGYHCDCTQGYQLSDDGLGCEGNIFNYLVTEDHIDELVICNCSHFQTLIRR